MQSAKIGYDAEVLRCERLEAEAAAMGRRAGDAAAAPAALATAAAPAPPVADVRGPLVPLAHSPPALRSHGGSSGASDPGLLLPAAASAVAGVGGGSHGGSSLDSQWTRVSLPRSTGEPEIDDEGEGGNDDDQLDSPAGGRAAY